MTYIYTKRFPKIFTDEEMSKVQETIFESNDYLPNEVGTFLRWRDWTAIAVMYYCGLRPAECLQLKWSDIDFNEKEILVKPYINKRKNDLPAILTGPAEKMLLKYKEVHNKNTPPTCEWIFPSIQSWVPLAVCSMDKRFLRVCREANLVSLKFKSESGQPHYNINLYCLRHSFCTRIYKKTGSEIAVSRLARHTQVASASIYTHLNFDDKKQIANFVFNQ